MRGALKYRLRNGQLPEPDAARNAEVERWLEQGSEPGAPT